MSANAGSVTLYIASSVDGHVAEADGSVDWLEAYEGGEGSYDGFLAGVDCLVMGSRTYEQVLGFGEWPYGDRPTYVLTGRDLPFAADSVELVDGDVTDLAARLKREHGHVWLVGGAELARSFLRAGLVDELRLSVVPVLLGGGVELFDGTDDRRALTLLGTETYGSGIVELRYEIGG